MFWWYNWRPVQSSSVSGFDLEEISFETCSCFLACASCLVLELFAFCVAGSHGAGVRTLFCVAGARAQTIFSRLRNAGVHALCHTPDKNMWVKMKEWWVKNLVVVISKLWR